MTKTTAKTPAPELPPDVTPEDLKYPSYESKVRIVHKDGQPTQLTFYKVKGSRIKDEWVILTLPIDNKGRSYIVQVSSGAIGRAGRGPHVKAEVTVYVTTANVDRLQKYLDLWSKGMEQAGSVRDRISSRRAQGQVERAAGKHSWRWDS